MSDDGSSVGSREGEPLSAGVSRTPEELSLTYINLGGQRCPVCGYDLRGLARLVCPECGAPLTLELGSPRLRLAMWLVGVVTLSMALGFDAVVLTLLSVAATLNRPRTPAEIQQVLFIFGSFVTLAAISGFALTRVVKHRRRWARWSEKRQRVMAAAIGCGIVFVHLAGAAVMLYRAN